MSRVTRQGSAEVDGGDPVEVESTVVDHEPTDPGRASRRTVYLCGLVTAVGVILGYASVLLANARHFYTDDTESQYTGLWVGLGHALREGTFPVLVPERWMSGNNTMDDAGLFNPPQLLIDLIAPSVDNMALYATLVKLIFAIIAALGVYRICLAYGGRPAWSAVAGVAFPLSGFFLFFDEASWMTALTGTAWMVHAWASSVRYTRGQAGPIPVFVYLYLTISTQYIFPAVEAALMLLAVAVGELVYQRKWWPVARLAIVGGCAGLAGLLTFLPSMLSAKVTWRGTMEINNDQFLTVPWSESLNASLPSSLPAFTSWWGYVQPMPVTYIAWFLIPALAFIDWRRARDSWRELSGVAFFAVMMLMWAAGPGSIGPLRWPVRVLPMLAIGLLVLVCVLLARYGTTRDLRNRGIAAGVLILLLWVRTFSADPHDAIWHVLAAVAVVALGIAVLWLDRVKGVAAACALAIVAMFPIAFFQVQAAQPTPMTWNLPTNRSDAKAAFPDFPGTTLQLAERGLLQPGDKSLDGAYGSLVFGNYAKSLELTYVNGYTPTGHYYFGELLCMRWDSSVCPDALRRMFTAEPTTGRTLADLMKLDRVVLQRALFPDARNQPAPDGWKWVDYPGHEKYIWVLERVDGPISTVNGRVAATKNVTAASISETDTTSRVRVSSPSGGRVVFSRLGWPGYRVTIDGKQIPITTVAKSFVAVDIPAGTQNAELVLTWRPPGWKIGIGALVAGVVGVGVLQWLYVRSRRRAKESAAAR
ncbi:4-amino-4-deoxy-L-arabinose transferase-like glycosyltransferase [Nocardia tenerifensis]|uniref:4-amino-4-deoxy-L-arabinose transferase-like glycosyltransferase n=1 Tax=Nocardia tenerifensis TaxID=228006 RepID=A0A318JQT9_9NOCA|nr:4-amino-4-deoxy-L-arabinose transferase-like glycosyltransferase [Nocardia tenerifensis]